jgi:hypothetical protein
MRGEEITRQNERERERERESAEMHARTQAALAQKYNFVHHLATVVPSLLILRHQFLIGTLIGASRWGCL